MRAVVLSLAAGGISTAIVATDSLLAGHGLDQLPVASILQALILPAVFGALSQAVSFRRAVGQITSHARVNTGSRLLSAQRGASCGKVNLPGEPLLMSDSFLSSDEYAEKAHQLYNTGFFDDAIELVLDGLAIYPTSVELHVALG